MKKCIFIFLVLVFTGIMTACAGSANVSSAIPSASLTSSLSKSVSPSVSSDPLVSSRAIADENESPVIEINEGQNESGAAKTLVVYFSHTGNTKAVAEQIAELTGGDLFEIQTVAAYPAEYEATTEVAKKEQTENARPELSSFLENHVDYDTVFIGYPIWWGDMPMAVYSFLDAYDFSGKTLLPFCTHGGSGLSGTDAHIQAEEPNASVSTAFAINGSSVADMGQAVIDWLKSTDVLTE